MSKVPTQGGSLNPPPCHGAHGLTTISTKACEPKPFLRWPGGKTWLLPHLRPLIRDLSGRYIEPFLGGGSLFFGLRPAGIAHLSDTNSQLVESYQQIATAVDLVWDSFSDLRRTHGPAQYAYIRERVPSKPSERAARLIYLNRTSFNGLYRVNKLGQFNVPIGTSRLGAVTYESLKVCSNVLRKANLTAVDFEQQVERAVEGDVVMLDPPYTVKHNKNGFVRYNERIFSWADQERLAEVATSAVRRGAQVFIMNADHPSVHSLYAASRFEITSHSRFSTVSARKSGRNTCQEILIKSRSQEAQPS